MKRKCKVCEFVSWGSNGWDLLTEHWQDNHSVEYNRVQRWLRGVDEKLEAAERLATEGMKGCNGTDNRTHK